MATMKPRQKWVAELDDARLSYAEIAAILGHEIVTAKQGGESIIDWYFINEFVKTDVFLSVLAAKRWKLSYPKGKSTCFEFDSYKNPETKCGDYDYTFRASVSEDDKTDIDCVLTRCTNVTQENGHRTIVRVIARMTLDQEYMTFLGALGYKGSDDEWDRVED